MQGSNGERNKVKWKKKDYSVHQEQPLRGKNPLPPSLNPRKDKENSLRDPLETTIDKNNKTTTTTTLKLNHVFFSLFYVTILLVTFVRIKFKKKNDTIACIH